MIPAVHSIHAVRLYRLKKSLIMLCPSLVQPIPLSKVKATGDFHSRFRTGNGYFLWGVKGLIAN